MKKKPRLVFISHSGSDTWVAKQIAREISTCGAEPFLDEAAINVGSDFEKDILEFLQKAHELVVLLTPWAMGRPYVWAEVGAAWGRQIPIVVLLLGMKASELQGRPEVPVFLKKRNMIELNEIAKYLSELKGRANGGSK
jgi:hypothetical protein